MNANDRKEFSRVLAGLATLFHAEQTAAGFELFFNSLRDWSLDEFKAAASHLARSCQFMPKPYDFEQLRRAHGTSASEAWAVVLKSCVDWRNPERLPQGRIARAAQVVGGFHAIAFADAQRELPWLAKRFREAFEELTEVETAREALPQLTPSANELALARDAVRALAAPSR